MIPILWAFLLSGAHWLMPILDADFPDKFQVLFEPHRFKVFYGGRIGGKTENFARALLIQGIQEPLRILCVREVQNSLAESVHKTLSDAIETYGFGGHYSVQQSKIYGPSFQVVDAESGRTVTRQTEFSFEGLRDTGKIKSYAGIDRCWVEEAQTVSKPSWDMLIPTILRRDGPEIWVSFNPDLETDETYKRFIRNPPIDCVVVFTNYLDNPWVSGKTLRDIEDLKEKNFDEYLHIYLGHCKVTLDGAVYANELREAISQNRLTKVPYDPTFGVETFWDLGFMDMTCIWFAQKVGFEYHFIDYYEDRQKPLNHYLKVLETKPYLISNINLPHDAKATQLGSGKSIQELVRKAGRKVKIVPKLKLYDGINAARTIFPVCWFDAGRCSLGLERLKHYQYDVVNGQYSRQPKHDDASHGADAFRYAAIGLGGATPGDKVDLTSVRQKSLSKWFPGPMNWMGI